MKQWIRKPIIEPMSHRTATVFEHTPVAYYRYGEYPRFIRPVSAYQPRADWALVESGEVTK